MRKIFIACLAVMVGASAGAAQQDHQPYSGLEGRAIAALSAQDISELEAGRGWGLALAAELNGYPGPTHVLELAEELALSDVQRERFTVLFEEMRAQAIGAGRDLIAAEAALDRAFRDGSVTDGGLRELVDAAARARGDLRFIHLSRHLRTVDILSPEQIERYSVLRGYAADPCASVPEGHDAALWRRHNGCEG